MNKKYERYINYIVNDIETPYFINMRDSYGLSEKEYSLVLSKVFNQPVTIKDTLVYDTNGKVIYSESFDGFWVKREYNTNGKEIYRENSDGDWYKHEYNTNGKQIYYENSSGDWVKREYNTNGKVTYSENSNGYWIKQVYDTNGNRIYFEDSNGTIRDNRR
jgi:hypothetical protein